VIAREQQGGDLRARKAHDAFAPLALESRRWGTVAIGIAGEDNQVDLLINGSVNDEIQGSQEVHHALRQSGRGVMLPVVSHVDMRISKMEEFDHGVIIIYGGKGNVTDWSLRQQHTMTCRSECAFCSFGQ